MVAQLTGFAQIEPDSTLPGLARFTVCSWPWGFAFALAWDTLASSVVKHVQPGNMGVVSAHGATLDQRSLEAESFQVGKF